jgi:hypothetical protein
VIACGDPPRCCRIRSSSSAAIGRSIAPPPCIKELIAVSGYEPVVPTRTRPVSPPRDRRRPCPSDAG